MSDTSSLLAQAKTFVHDNKTYHVSLITQAVKAEFEQWLKKQALDLLLELKTVVDPMEWQTFFNEHKEEVAIGKYAFHGELAQKALKTPAASLHFASLLFNCPEDEMARLVIARPDEVQALLESVNVESFPFKKDDDQGNWLARRE